MKYFVILGVFGFLFLSSYLQETEARTIPPLHIVLEDSTITQNSFITANGGVPTITIQKGEVVSFPLTVNPYGSESLPVGFFHSIEFSIPDTHQSTLPDMKIELDPFYMVLKPDEPQIMSVTITALNYTQLGEHKINLTAQYPQGDVLLNTRFDVFVIDENQNENYQFIDFTYANIKGDPIRFILERTALGNCTSFQAEIIDESGNVVWGEGSFALCDPITNPSLITSEIRIGYDENNPILIDDFGYYVLKVQIDDSVIEKEFMVRPKPTGVAYDRTEHSIPYTVISPLKQIHSGVPLDEIRCKDNVVLIQKYDGSPACVTHNTKEKLIERRWATTYPDTYDTKTVFEIVKDEKIFDVEYKIKGGSVEDMVYDKEVNTLLTTIDSSGEGKFTVVIPRDLLDAKMDYCPPLKANPPDGRFFVLLDGKEIPYDEILTTSEKRTLQIPFTGDVMLEIIGACLI